uniref:Galectin n=1 Tax=Andrias davidianus TaxID=141262 RepID=A0A1S5V2L7_ANDDA|nr:galectin-1 [Andrias davidianus]
MEQELVINNLNLKAGKCVDITGDIPKDSKCFAINLGKDCCNLVLHFNPRFDHLGDVNTIVCNSKDAEAWGEEQRECAFPYQQGDKVEVCIHFDKEELTMKLPKGQEIKFPNRLGLETVNFLSVEGFHLKSLKLD